MDIGGHDADRWPEFKLVVEAGVHVDKAHFLLACFRNNLASDLVWPPPALLLVLCLRITMYPPMFYTVWTA